MSDWRTVYLARSNQTDALRQGTFTAAHLNPLCPQLSRSDGGRVLSLPARVDGRSALLQHKDKGGWMRLPVCSSCQDWRPADNGWKARAACAPQRRHPSVGADLWFSRSTRQRRQAAEICRRCPVRAECFGFAVAEGLTDGIWGGAGGVRLRKEIADRRRARYENTA